MPAKGLPGRLSKGAGTHLASWLQESTALTPQEAQSLLDSCESRAKNSPKGEKALAGLRDRHGNRCGHSKPITDVAFSGDLLVSKDDGSMRMWRSGGDYALLRVVACRGKHVAFHRTGQFIVTGTRNEASGDGEDDGCASKARPLCKGLKVWGPAGGSAVGAGNAKITTGVT